MYLIVGLGNPEPEYCFTRHNMGFDVINKLAEKWNLSVNKKGFQSIYGSGIVENEKVILCKPQTFMNLSGNAVVDIMDFYKISTENLIIVFDDIDIKTGTIKIRKKGSDGGHNGMRSLIDMLQTQEFIRVRVGTGFCENRKYLTDYVINRVPNDEYIKLLEGINLGVDATEEIIKSGIDNAMNKFN